ncbi:HAAS signaling domain-containing protein [Pseudomarimonas arenosa]|uniref:DUF1700 domain-containing protein n=1 Tax=Pseudomarimonas arenosa TaxID=2774145 RepID=A0AAW3ZML7_9GAMM|nr:hypothetical protein [Pseudomarimonas arenosa]MBD8527388.1 hypothetical protein [Pseudomarimonas arenosa]
MTDRELIHDYLKSLSSYLSRLDKADADEVVREIESHVHDALEEQIANGQSADARAILAGLGTPRELASQYVGHILQGTPPPTGFRAIQRVKQQATRGLFWATAVLGAITSGALVLLAAYELWEPAAVGLWSSEDGRTLVVGMVSPSPANSRELLGNLLAPIALAGGISLAWLTKRLLAVLKPKR